MLSKNQFEVLVYIESKQNEKISQREISSNINISLGTVNKIMSELMQVGLIVQKDQFIHITTKQFF